MDAVIEWLGRPGNHDKVVRRIGMFAVACGSVVSAMLLTATFLR